MLVPSAAANFSDSLSLVQSGAPGTDAGAQDGKPASFFVGDRFPPVTLSLRSGSLGTVAR